MDRFQKLIDIKIAYTFRDVLIGDKEVVAYILALTKSLLQGSIRIVKPIKTYIRLLTPDPKEVPKIISLNVQIVSTFKEIKKLLQIYDIFKRN